MAFSTSSNRKTYYVASGVRADFEKLMETFKETKTVRYESFSQIWKDMKIPLIFFDRKTDVIMAEFVYECLHIAAEYWLQSNSLQIQIGGLYLVYGIFETQRCNPKIRLMLTLTEWEKVQKFGTNIQEQCHYDVCYVYRKLVMKRAFYYCASSRLVKVSNKMKAESVRRELTEKSERTTISDLLDSANIAHLDALHTQYHIMKCALAGPQSTKPDPSLRVINTDIVDAIQQKVASFKQWEKNPHTQRATYRERQRRLANEWRSHEDDDDNSLSFRKNRRAEIKEHAFKSDGQVRRDRRHRQTTSPKKSAKKKKSGSETVSTEDEDVPSFTLVPSTSTLDSDRLPSMPQFSELEASTSDKHDNTPQKTPPRSSKKSTKTPKVILSPKKGKGPKSVSSTKSKKATTASSEKHKTTSPRIARESPTVRKRGRPDKKSAKGKDCVKKEVDDDIKSEPESLPEITHNKGRRRSSTQSKTVKAATKPVKTATCKPVKAKCKPVKTATSKPVKAAKCKPVKTATSKPVKTVTGKPVKAATCKPVKDVACKPAKGRKRSADKDISAAGGKRKKT